MAISDDLRGIQVTLSELASGNEELVCLLCDNLESLADQVEALEELPFSPGGMPPVLSSYAVGGSSSLRGVGLLQ